MAEFVIGQAALERRLQAISTATLGPRMMRSLGLATVAIAKQKVPRKTGNLGRSIHVGVVTASSVQVEASANYARYVEEGTRPHEITPNAKKALAFASQYITTQRFGAGATLKFRKSGSLTAGSMRKYGNAAFVVVKRVHHPGTAAKPFLMPAAKEAVATGGLADVIVLAWNEAG